MTDMTKKTKQPTERVIYEVIGIGSDDREFVVDRFTSPEVAEFRANGAKLFASVGDDTTYVVRPAKLIQDIDVATFLKRVGR